MTPQERKAYIATSRRSQPIEELRRKERKSRRRSNGMHMERADLSLREYHDRPKLFNLPAPTHYCPHCSAFGKHWDDDLKVYHIAPTHSPRCIYAPDDGPYPGWNAAGISVPKFLSAYPDSFAA